MSSLALIPARSGSKGLIDKNIRPLAGRPLIAWSIRAALEADVFDEVMVSTDSEEYADIARDAGASVPFLRPDALASDTAKALDVYRDVLRAYGERGENFDAFAVLLPTTPLRSAAQVREAFGQIAAKPECRGVVSVTPLEHPVEWANTLPADLSLANFLSEAVQRGNRQDFKQRYRPNGAIYAVETGYFAEIGGFYGPGTYAYVMEPRDSVDIDTDFDFRLAEWLLMERMK